MIHGNLSFTDNELTEIFGWPNFDGFTGDTCWACGVVVNVLAGKGWFCPCGFRNQSSSSRQKLYAAPVYGPTAARIHAAVDAKRAAIPDPKGKQGKQDAS